MTSLTPPTSRASGTILTAIIYNADHLNHYINELALDASIGDRYTKSESDARYNVVGSGSLLKRRAMLGIDGEQGDEGFPGQRGRPGPAGAAGPGGAKGKTLPGVAGSDGDDGSSGPPGRRGLAGAQGVPGRRLQALTADDGDDGPPGLPGRRGRDGNPGRRLFLIQGDEGDAGDQGQPGRRGAAGTAGIDGASIDVADLVAQMKEVNQLLFQIMLIISDQDPVLESLIG